MNRWPWLLVLVGSILLFLSISDRMFTKTPEPASSTIAGEPDLYMAKATTTQYGDDGAVSYSLWSDETKYFESDDVTHLVSPTLTLNRAPQPSWSASAKQGIVNYKNTADGKREEVVELSGDVHLARREPPDPIEITCPSLVVYPDRQFAETDQPVMITGNSGSTSAVGLSGYLNSGHFTLKSSTNQRVHTVVLPGQFQPAPQ